MSRGSRRGGEEFVGGVLHVEDFPGAVVAVPEFAPGVGVCVAEGEHRPHEPTSGVVHIGGFGCPEVLLRATALGERRVEARCRTAVDQQEAG